MIVFMHIAVTKPNVYFKLLFGKHFVFHKRQSMNDCRLIRSNLKAFKNACEDFVIKCIIGKKSDFENSLRIFVSDKSSRKLYAF